MNIVPEYERSSVTSRSKKTSVSCGPLDSSLEKNPGSFGADEMRREEFVKGFRERTRK